MTARTRSGAIALALALTLVVAGLVSPVGASTAAADDHDSSIAQDAPQDGAGSGAGDGGDGGDGASGAAGPAEARAMAEAALAECRRLVAEFVADRAAAGDPPVGDPGRAAPDSVREASAPGTGERVDQPLIDDPDCLNEELAVARDVLTSSTALLHTTRKLATQSTAESRRLTREAAEFDEVAQNAARAQVLAARPQGSRELRRAYTDPSTGDLLAALGTADRLARLAAGASAFGRTAERYRALAEAARQRDANLRAVGWDERVREAEDAASAAQAEVDRITREIGERNERLTVLSVLTAGSGWTRPVVGRITDGFGNRVKPLPDASEFHRGIDLAAACGAPVRAAASGTVLAAGPNGGLGNWIAIEHGGVVTGYGHLSDGSLAVSVGDRVSGGQVIGTVGSTGTSTGCHLHLEVAVDGVAVDPVPFFSARGIRFAP